MTIVHPLHAQIASKQYSEYKDSGIEWLGEVPAHWAVSRLRFLCRISPSKNEIPELSSDTEVYFIPMELILEGGQPEYSETRYLYEVQEGYTYCREDDVLVAKITPCFENKKGLLVQNLRSGFAFGTTELHVLRSGPQITPSFLYYLTLTHQFRSLGAAHMYGSAGQQRVPDEFVKDYRVAIPPLEEQHAISLFIERETANIDALIAKKERLIRLLQEKCTAIMSHAVTKGLDPNASMRDSGIEWLGEIPAHWEVKRLKYLVHFYSGGTPSKENLEFWDGTIPWVSPKDMKGEIISDSEDHITEDALANSATRLIPQNSLLVVVRSGILRHSLPVGITARPVAINQDIKAVVPRQIIDSHYLRYFMEGKEEELLVECRKGGATVESIEQELLSHAPCLLPPVTEQRLIADYLQRKVAYINGLTDKIHSHIEKLQERSIALISAAVTGNICVCEQKETVEQKPKGKPKKENRANPFFRRSVLVAEIVHQLHSEITFGRVKLQKALYLAEHHRGLTGLETNYQRDAAGPFDNRGLRSAESQLQAQKWYKAVSREGGGGTQYVPLESAGGHSVYFDKYWGEHKEAFQKLIDLLRPIRTRQCEIIATLYAAWNDFLLDGKTCDDDSIVQEVLTNWHKSKEQIPEINWRNTLKGMRKEGLVPRGTGQKTRHKA